MKFFNFLLFIFLLRLTAFADKPANYVYVDKLANNVYLHFHPFTLPINPFVFVSMLNDRPFTVYLTLEYTLNRYVSIPVNPSFWLKPDIYYRLGSGAGIRYYLEGRGPGPYLQLMPAHYLKRSLSGEENVSGRVTDIKFYIGYGAGDIFLEMGGRGLFCDMGIGYYSGPNHRGVSVDINFGIGFQLL